MGSALIGRLLFAPNVESVGMISSGDVIYHKFTLEDLAEYGYRKTIGGQTINEVIDGAINLLKTHGHCKDGSNRNKMGQYGLLGAINDWPVDSDGFEIDESKMEEFGRIQSNEQAEVERRLCKKLGVDNQHDLAIWSEQSDRTFDEVIRLLESCKD